MSAGPIAQHSTGRGTARIAALAVAILSLFVASANVGGTPVRAGEIGFSEDFALALDRTVPLKQLIPGTDDYYYYHALHALATQQYEQAEQLLRPWEDRHRRTPRLLEIETRLALLTYDKNPQKTLDHLRRRLNLGYGHQKEVLGRAPDLPTQLNADLIRRATLLKRAYGEAPSLDPFEDAALEWLIAEELTPDRRRHLLSRLQRPDYPNIAKLIVDDLNHPNSGGFGSLGVHNLLLRSQLDECLKLKPDLANQGAFVNAYLIRLQPAPDEDWRHDATLLSAYLDRLQAYVDTLAPVHNSLKAHVLYHRLVLDRSRGQMDKARLMAYLKLPRPLPYVAPKFLQSDESRRFTVDMNANYAAGTLLAPIGNDEPLVRAYLQNFLVDATGYAEFEPYVHDVYLKHLFAETKIVNGLGEPEQWASLLPPELFKQLKDRVDIDFAATNPTSFAADAPVKLDLHVKNVGTLIVKVFEINTQNYYRQELREIDTDINLDGLVANTEQTFTYNDAPLRRVARKFEFPQMNKPGVYVVDFIGNGRSSRALIRKGRLRHVSRTGTTGQVITVFDEQNRKVNDATVWLQGHEYKAEKDGKIVVPFSSTPGTQSIVLGRGEFASLDSFQHEPESYELRVGFYVDRESLLEFQRATVLIRPRLLLNGTPISPKLLEDVRLRIQSVNQDGVASSQELGSVELFDDRETTHEFIVPQRLAQLHFVLMGRIKSLIQGTPIDVQAGDGFALNEIAKTDKIDDLHLSKLDANWVLEVRGRSGEPKPNRPVNLAIKHRDVKRTVDVTLKTDERGRIVLGVLADIDRVTAAGPEGTQHTWSLARDRHTYPSVVHGKAGETISIPYLGQAPAASRAEMSLLELRSGTYVADHFDKLAVRNGMVEIAKLAPGDYDLLLKATGDRVQVRVVAGERQDGYVLGGLRLLESRPLSPVQIESVKPVEDKVVVQLRQASKFARVHVFASRFEPAFSAYNQLASIGMPGLTAMTPGSAESVYLTGRNIGDEYRYIIDRRYAKKYPGNTLQRPELLLNPWVLRTTETGQQVAQGGDAFDAAGEMRSGLAKREGGGAAGAAPKGDFASLEFLGFASSVLVNLTPDDKGVIEIPRAAIGNRQRLYIVAVDPLVTTVRSIALPEADLRLRDLRLHEALKPDAHFTQQKQISIVRAGETITIADLRTSRFEVYDSLARFYRLFATLTNDSNLNEFRFIQGWNKLKPEEKRDHYSRYASHELSFFLAKKDPEFFKEAIAPYLANKKDKTFLDQWLIGAPLDTHLQPWNHGRLNTAERILLGQRVADERPITARHVREQYELLPPDLDRFLRLFETAVQGNALEAGEKANLLGELDKKLAPMRDEAAAAAPPQAAPAPRPVATAGAAPAPPGMPALAGKPMAADALRKSGAVEREAKQMLAEKAAKDGDSSRWFRRNAAQDRKQVELYFEQTREADKIRQLYRQLDPTKEYAENNYYHLPIAAQTADLIKVNSFWRDYAEHDPAQPFQSRNTADASRNFAEMMLALSLLDLPFEAGKHETKSDETGLRYSIKAASPLIVYHEELKPAAAPDQAVRILVSQNFFRHNDRYRQENGEQVDKFVTDEFLVHTVYGCQIVVTNPTSSRQKLNVLVQIPLGAIPVLNGQQTRTIHLDLQPYHTQTFEYHFYFPAAGDFVQFPVHVARNEQLLASAAPFTFHVVDTPTKIDTQSWEYVSQNGTNDEVIAFLEKNNIGRLNLDKIAFRMRDKAYFEQVIGLLAKRHVYHGTLWSYALMHNVASAAREFLQHQDGLVAECGGRLDSPLLTIKPVARFAYQHLEYKPLVNARAHSLGARRQIVNDALHQQYHSLLHQLSYERELNDTDWLDVTYYLLLQDRVEEALASFARVRPDRIATRMQYDYAAAYLDFYQDQPKVARAIATKYATHPVDRWRNAFAAIIAQLDEIEGKNVVAVDPENRDQQQTKLAATEPSFEIKMTDRTLEVTAQNLKTVRVSYYLMDIELLFSRNPFVQQFSGQFSSIRPNLTADVDLGEAVAGKPTVKQIPLPESLLNKNVLIEVTGAGQTRNQAYYAHSLNVQVIENYGQVKVTHAKTGQPVAKSYVKVYAQHADGSVKFYKDGYTDLRGRFEYASLSTSDLQTAGKFAILVMSEEFGALVREAAPPKQ